MIVGYKYIAMTITGAMHLVVGVFCLVCSIIAFTTRKYYSPYMRIYSYSTIFYGSAFSNSTSASALIASLWAIAVGVFGILAGLKSIPEHRTRSMKTAYMVLAILSACIFSIVGLTAFSMHSVWILIFGLYKHYVLFATASFVMFVEFILAIVSSSICCCCSEAPVVPVSSPNVTVHSSQVSQHGYPGYPMN